MKVVITGAFSFLGHNLAEYLLSPDSPIQVTELILADTVPSKVRIDKRVKRLVLDITAPDAADKLIDSKCDVFYHLGGVPSSHSELEFDFGFKGNFEASRSLLEKARHSVPNLKFVFVSTLAVYGGDLPPIVNEYVAAMPQNSYGSAKAMVELLVNEYSRRGFVDGIVVRLPAVTVRPGAASEPINYFASLIIDGPLNREEVVCPTRLDLVSWVTSTATVVRNIAHAGTLATGALGKWRCVNMPGFGVSVQEMLDALEAVGGKRALYSLRFEREPRVELLLESLPKKFDNARALSLGFTVDTNFLDVVHAYVRDYLKRKI